METITKYMVTDEQLNLSLCDDGGDWVVKSDNSPKPMVIFESEAQAQIEANKLNDSGEYTATMFIACPIECDVE